MCTSLAILGAPPEAEPSPPRLLQRHQHGADRHLGGRNLRLHVAEAPGLLDLGRAHCGVQPAQVPGTPAMGDGRWEMDGSLWQTLAQKTTGMEDPLCFMGRYTINGWQTFMII